MLYKAQILTVAHKQALVLHQVTWNIMTLQYEIVSLNGLSGKFFVYNPLMYLLTATQHIPKF